MAIGIGGSYNQKNIAWPSLEKCHQNPVVGDAHRGQCHECMEGRWEG